MLVGLKCVLLAFYRPIDLHWSNCCGHEVIHTGHSVGHRPVEEKIGQGLCLEDSCRHEL